MRKQAKIWRRCPRKSFYYDFFANANLNTIDKIDMKNVDQKLSIV